MVRLTNYVAVLPEKMSQVTHLMVKSTNIWVVTRVVHVTYSESVGVTILLVAVSVKFSQATVFYFGWINQSNCCSLSKDSSCAILLVTTTNSLILSTLAP